MAVATRRSEGCVPGRASGRDATRVVVAVLGTLAGLAGIEHGVGEMLQGPVRPEGLLIMSWPDTAALEILAGEPASGAFGPSHRAGVAVVLAGAVLGYLGLMPSMALASVWGVASEALVIGLAAFAFANFALALAAARADDRLEAATR